MCDCACVCGAERVSICKEELISMLEEEELKEAALCVLANKQDLPGALSPVNTHERSHQHTRTHTHTLSHTHLHGTEARACGRALSSLSRSLSPLSRSLSSLSRSLSSLSHSRWSLSHLTPVSLASVFKSFPCVYMSSHDANLCVRVCVCVCVCVCVMQICVCV